MTKKYFGPLGLTYSLLIVQFGFAFCNNSMSVLINPLVAEYGLTGGMQGLPASAVQAGALISVLLAPFAGGKVHKLTLLAIGAVLQAAMTFLTGASPLFFLVLAACAVMGMGCGLIDVFGNSVLLDMHGENSTRYMGMLHSVYGVAAVITPLVLQGLLSIGWRVVVILVAIPLFLFAFQFIFVSRRRVPGLLRQESAPEKLGGKKLAAYLKNSGNLTLLGCFFFYSMGQFGIMGWLVRYMAVRYNAEALGALAVALYWAGTAISRLAAPMIRRPLMQLVTAGLVAACALQFAGVMAGDATVMVVTAALVGLAGGHTIPMLLGVAAAACPEDSALPTSVLMVSNKVGMAAIPLVFGAVAAFSMQLSMYIGAFCTGAALLMALAFMSIQKKKMQA